MISGPFNTLSAELDRKWPLPHVPFIGAEESRRRQDAYSAHRREYRRLHPDRPREDLE